MKIQTLSKMLLFAFMLSWSACQEKKGADDMIVVNNQGEITLFGKNVELENLQSVLMDSLSKMPNIPDSISVKYDSEILMGMRGEVFTEVNQAIRLAKAAKLAPVVLPHVFKKEQGTDCDQPDSLRTGCATIDFQYPVVEAGPKPLQGSVDQWTNAYLTGILTGGSMEENVSAITLEEAANVFFSRHEEFKGSAEYSGFEASTSTDVLLNDGKYLSLSIDGYCFQGGAHGSPTASLATFDVPSGHKLSWDDIVTDKAAMQTLAEKHFKAERADIFQDGFEFDEVFQFKLPDNFALVKTGIHLHYLHYEVGPYAIGSTTFVIPFTEMGAILKIQN